MARQPVAAAAVRQVSTVGQAGGIYQRHAQLSSTRCTRAWGGQCDTSHEVARAGWSTRVNQRAARHEVSSKHQPEWVENALPHAAGHAPKLLA